MRKTRFTAVATILLGIFFATSIPSGASAALLNYNEAIDGEIGFFTHTFTLDMAGNNLISGSGFRNSTGFDNDSFFLNLANGLQIDDYSVSIQNVFQIGGVFHPQWALRELDTNTTLWNVDFDLATNSILNVFLAGSEPYDFSSYSVLFGGSTPIGMLVDSAGWNWQITIETSSIAPIPLPAAFPLFGTGLGILGFLGWRRRRKAQAV